MNSNISFNSGLLSSVMLMKHVEIDDLTKKRTTNYKTRWAFMDILNQMLIGTKGMENELCEYPLTNSPLYGLTNEVHTYLIGKDGDEHFHLKYKTETVEENEKRMKDRRAAKEISDREAIVLNSVILDDSSQKHIFSDDDDESFTNFLFEVADQLIESICKMAFSFNNTETPESNLLRFVDFEDCFKFLKFVSLNSKSIYKADQIFHVIKLNTLASFHNTPNVFMFATIPSIDVVIAATKKSITPEKFNQKLSDNNTDIVSQSERLLMFNGTEKKLINYHIMTYTGVFIEVESYNSVLKHFGAPRRMITSNIHSKPTPFNMMY